MKGTIVRYNKAKGFGFINVPGQEKDIFVHITSVSNAKHLEQGQSVTFETEETEKGIAAVSVKVGGAKKSPILIYAILVIAIIAIGFFLLQ